MNRNFTYLPDINADSLKTALGEAPLKPEGGYILFLAEAGWESIPVIQKTFKDLGVVFAGAVFPELIVGNRFQKNGLLMIRCDPMPSLIFSEQISEDGKIHEENLENLLAGLEEQIDSNRHQTLFAVFDAMVPTVASTLDRIYLRLSNRVKYMGVNCGSETFQPLPCLFDHDQLVKNAALFLLLDEHPGALIEHGFSLPEEIIIATSAEGNKIGSINWQNAFEVYTGYVQKQYGVEITRENFYQYGVHFPFGIVRGDGQLIIRIPVAYDETGALFCVGEVPSGSILTLLKSPEWKSMVAVNNIKKRVDAGAPRYLLFYCAGRRLHFGEEALKEMDELAEFLLPERTAGALSLGEMGNNEGRGYPLFHNAALVVSPI